MMKRLKYELKYKLGKIRFIKALFSPFKPFSLKFYSGKIAIGVPYFFPRKWVKSKEKPGYLFPVPKKIGFNSCGLGWKTKWEETDYRFESSPILSFVFFKWQIAIIVSAEYQDNYWTSWLYYEYNTDKTKSNKERIEQCIKCFPQKYTIYYPDGREEGVIDYYELILKRKHRKLL